MVFTLGWGVLLGRLGYTDSWVQDLWGVGGAEGLGCY